jgi:transposase
MRQVDRLTQDMTRIRDQIITIGRRQPACRALQAAHYGIGPLTAVIIWAEMGDIRRFRSSDDAVRHTGLDVTVYSSDGRRSAGHLARQGPPLLRWALYEAAVYAGRPSSPDHPERWGPRSTLTSPGTSANVTRTGVDSWCATAPTNPARSSPVPGQWK